MNFYLKFLFVIILSFSNGYSQSLTLADLIKLNNLTEDNFDTFITSKGFKYNDFENLENANQKSYVFYIKGIKNSYVSKFTYTSKNKEMVSFQTPNSSIYLNFKKELLRFGFSYKKTETYKNTTFMYYGKGNLELTLTSSIDQSRISGEKTFYEISISK